MVTETVKIFNLAFAPISDDESDKDIDLGDDDLEKDMDGDGDDEFSPSAASDDDGLEEGGSEM